MPATRYRSQWTTLNVVLHWTIVVLIVGQWLEGEYMSAFWDGTLDGKALGHLTVILGYTHIVFGTLVLVATAVRLLDRYTNGRPPHAENEPNWASVLAKVTHVLLYSVLLVIPVLGLAAWFTGSENFAYYHTLLWNPLLVLIGLHIVGALAQHFWFKTGVLKRMVPGLRHTA